MYNLYNKLHHLDFAMRTMKPHFRQLDVAVRHLDIATRNLKPKFRLFDVTMRDGLQSMSNVYTMKHKKKLLDRIIKNCPTTDIEIGSMVSPKILPQMRDSLSLYKYAEKKYPTHNFYMLVPNQHLFTKAMENGVKNFSFITSVSDAFQKKNINKSLDDTQYELFQMTNQLTSKNKSKLYVSCVTECPINGKIPIEQVAFKINNNLNFEIDNICISDTCGTLSISDYKYIIDNVNQDQLNKISLHLHNPSNPDLQDIIQYSLARNITRFDVSYIDAGGCSVTIDGGKMKSNLTYEIFE